MLFATQLIFLNIHENDVYFTDIEVHRFISLESIMVLYYKKQVISQIPDAYFSVLISIVFEEEI